MKLTRLARVSANALRSHALRTTLAVGSVAVGVAAVVVTSALGEGAEREVQRRLAAVGGNLLIVRPSQVPISPVRPGVRGAVTTLRLDDEAALARVPGVALSAPGLEARVRLEHRRTSTIAMVLGTTAAYADIRQVAVSRGRFLSDDDDARARRVLVLGARVAGAIFGDDGAVGATVSVRGVPFDVIGVLAPRGIGADGSDQDGEVFVPVRTALRRLYNVSWLSQIIVAAGRGRSSGEVTEAIAMELRRRRRPGVRDDFEVQDTARLVQIQRKVADALQGVSTATAAVALCVASIGIAAMMVSTVRDRTAEVGLRAAVGASPRDILAQFLCEAVGLAVAGWSLGSGVGAVTAWGMRMALAWPADVPARMLALSFGASVVTGLVSGVGPARRAARIPPAEALRSS